MKNSALALLIFLLWSNVFAQKQEVLRIDSLPAQGILLDKGWRWHAGDNPDFAKPDFDDSQWASVDPTKDIHDFPDIFDSKIRWLRLTIIVTDKIPQPLGLSVNQATASEVYLNGKLVQKIGLINPRNHHAEDPLDYPFYVPIDSAGTYHLAIRLTLQPNIYYTRLYALTQNNLFNARLVNLVATQNSQRDFRVYYTGLEVFKIGMLFMLCMLHLAFYLYQKSNKTHLLLAVYFFGACMQYVFKIIGQNSFSVEARYWYLNLSIWSAIIGGLFALWSFYRLSKTQFDIYFAIVLVSNIIGGILSSVTYGMIWSLLSFGTAILSFFVTLRLTRIGLKKKDKGFIVLGVAVMFSSLGFVFIELLNQNVPISPYIVDVFFNLSVIAIPVGLSLYMGIEASERNKSLTLKLLENEQLKEKAIAQEQEKQKILATQNETLERQVAERTAELKHKNRELEIEAALDKIRSASLAMHHSDEIEKVMGVLFERLKDLGLVFDGGAAIHFFAENTKDAIIWVASPDHMSEPHQINLPYDEPAFVGNPIILDVWEAHETGKHIINKTYTYEEKNRYFKDYLFKHNGYDKIPEFARNLILAAPSYTASFIYEKNSLMGANSWTGQKFSETDIELLKRIAKVFEQAYVRFLDLKKAEAQAREAQIQLALERVRARTMAMQKSDELAEASFLLDSQVRSLGIKTRGCGFNIYGENESTEWFSSELGTMPTYKTPREHFFLSYYEAGLRGETLLLREFIGEECAAHYDYLCSLPVAGEGLRQFKANGGSFPTQQIDHVVYFKYGYLLFITLKPVPEAHDVFKRFAKVFEQTYTRFLDLQKAEAQAREAQIEAALERIRSRTMQMNTSDELNTLIGFIYAECTKLNMQLDRGFIMTFDKNTKDAHWWMVGAEAPDMPISILVKYHEYAPNLAILDAWQKREQKWSYVVEGENKTTWDDFIFVETDLSLLPDFVKDSMRSVKSVILNASYQNFGCIMLSSFEPLSEQHFDLLIRLSKVFDLTYTRFLDLQLKEQNAIKLLEEKQKLERTLSELRATQTQLIQKEKLASLGELTAGIAHEIQNPLNFVNNFSELSIELADELKEEAEKPQIDKEIIIDLVTDLAQNQSKINHHGKRASSIVKGMLEHSRMGTGERQMTDLNVLCDEYLRLAYHGMRAKDKDGSATRFNCDYELIADENLPPLNVVPQDIGRVLLNLINNAFYAVQQRSKAPFPPMGASDYVPKVTVTTKYLPNNSSPIGGWGAISVSDNGTGIPENILPKIFPSPFSPPNPRAKGRAWACL